MSTLDILTLNAGLMRLRAFGVTLHAFAPYVVERYAALTAALLDADADVVLLQEVYQPTWRAELAATLADRYPFAGVRKKPATSWLGDGLLLFSKLPIERWGFTAFEATAMSERLFTTKGYLHAELRVDSRTVRIINTHTTAGGIRHPERPPVDALRSRQLQQILTDRTDAFATVLGGDLNAGPEASPSNYRALLDAGFTDVVAAHFESPQPFVTWDPNNPLNATSPHSRCPPQRIDHILVSAPARAVRVTAAARVFDTPFVKSNPHPVTLSDHCGVRVRLAL